jgi:hypothetical protein
MQNPAHAHARLAPTAPQIMMEQLIGAIEPSLPQLTTYEMIVLLAATARLRHAPSPAWLTRFFTLCEPRLRDCGTGNLTTLIRAVSKLGLEPWDLRAVPGFLQWLNGFLAASQKRMYAFRGDELVRMISALGELQHKPRAE